MGETYNGHPNRESWLVALWIANTEPMYLEVRENVRRRCDTAENRCQAIREVSDFLKQYIGDKCCIKGNGLAQDLLSGALGRVEWEHEAENLVDEQNIQWDDPDD